MFLFFILEVYVTKITKKRQARLTIVVGFRFLTFFRSSLLHYHLRKSSIILATYAAKQSKQ
jgi:hypothetical protein